MSDDFTVDNLAKSPDQDGQVDEAIELARIGREVFGYDDDVAVAAARDAITAAEKGSTHPW